jgi:glycosyltransferase involved in cell wall biosynthesis
LAHTKVAVIVVTHNSSPFIPKCLACLEAQTRPADKVVVVDSGSEDGGYLRR